VKLDFFLNTGYPISTKCDPRISENVPHASRYTVNWLGEWRKASAAAVATERG
jgi:hypothetical protein